MIHPLRTFRLFAGLLLLLLVTLVQAQVDSPISQLLQKDQPPEGVVFEIVTGDEDALEWAIPRTQQYIQQLRAKFPDLPIAVVTHGREMFSLQKSTEYISQDVHKQVKSLVAQQNVVLHVCGTYAGWRGLAEENFPPYVDVAAAGPAQINDYVAIGYVKIIIKNQH
jgi:intracellular sulfur oxidation DsrE/DsrF family protein